MKRDERIFVDDTLTRVQQLISKQIWEGMDFGRCRTWFSQFEEYDCELLGACLLDNFIFRSKRQVETLLKSVLTSPDLIANDPLGDWAMIERLRGYKIDPCIRLCPVIRLDKSPTKSGTYLLRLLAKSLRIQEKWMKWPQSLPQEPNDVHTVLLVDDFCGTGTQFADFITLTGLNQFMQDRPQCRIVYVVAAAHKQGISKINQDYPSIEILTGEYFDEKHHFFEGEMLKRINVDDLASQLKEQYETIANKTGLGGKLGKMGFGDQALTYSFAHGTPNNTLPIFWYENDKWSPLVDR